MPGLRSLPRPISPRPAQQPMKPGPWVRASGPGGAAQLPHQPLPTATRSFNASISLGPIPSMASSSSTEANGPCSFRQSTIRCAITGPTRGSVPSSSTDAVLMLTLAVAPPVVPAGVLAEPEPDPPVLSAGGGCDGSPTAGTRTLMPSVRTSARFRPPRSAFGAAPPAASMAWKTRLPAGNVTTPGAFTAPATWTSTVPAPAGPPGPGGCNGSAPSSSEPGSALMSNALDGLRGTAVGAAAREIHH